MNSYIGKIAMGLAISIIMTLILIFLFSVLLAYTNVSESIIAPVIIGITGISILSGSSITARQIKKKGIINGMITGGIYIFIIYIMSSAINKGYGLNNYAIIMMMTGIIAGAIGGIVGVNL